MSSVSEEGATQLKVLVCDATEPSQPDMYMIDVQADALHMPINEMNRVARKLYRKLRRNLNSTGQDMYEHVAVGGEDAGLISENSEDPEYDLEEIITYLQKTSRVAFRPSLHRGEIQVTISLACV